MQNLTKRDLLIKILTIGSFSLHILYSLSKEGPVCAPKQNINKQCQTVPNRNKCLCYILYVRLYAYGDNSGLYLKQEWNNKVSKLEQNLDS